MSVPHAYEPFPHSGHRGPFIVLEGVSGIGKSTLAERLATRLGASTLHTLPVPHSGWSPAVNECLRPLPQLAFYLSGALHAADSVRRYRTLGPVVADRYVSSVIACHAAAHRVEVAAVARLLDPFRPYLEVPDHTFYLRCSEPVLRKRLEAKGRAAKLTTDDAALFGEPGRLERLLANFDAVATDDPTSVVLDSDDKSPDELADWITAHLGCARA